MHLFWVIAVKVIFPYRNYTKMTMGQLDALVKDIRADPKRVRVLDILGGQLELFINTGQPDIYCPLASLEAEALVSGEDHEELKFAFALDRVCKHSHLS